MSARTEWVYFNVSYAGVAIREVKVLRLSYIKWKDNTQQLTALICQAAWHKLLHEMRGSTGDYWRHLQRKHGEAQVKAMLFKHIKFTLVTEEDHELRGHLKESQLPPGEWGRKGG